MNPTILRAQLWELWRLTRFDMLIRIGGTLAYLWLFTLLPDGVTETQGIVLVVIVLVSLGSVLWSTSYERRTGGGFPFSHGFTRPIPIVWLVAVPLAWLMTTNALIFLFLASIAEKTFDWDLAQYQYIPSILLGSTLVAALSWCITRFAERMAAWAVLGSGIVWLLSRGFLMMDPLMLDSRAAELLLSPDPVSHVLMLAGTLFVAFACVRAVARSRSGEINAVVPGQSLFAKSTLVNLERMHAFRSPRHAQFWFFLRKTGNRSLAVLAAGLTIMLVTAWGASEFGGDSLMAILWSASVIVTPLALLGGTVDGVLGLKYQGAESRLAIFEAIRPVTIRHNILQKLGIILGITLAGWTVFALGAFVVAAAFYGGFLRDLTALQSRDSGVAMLQMAGFIVAGYILATAACIAFALLLMSAGYVAPRLKEHPVACWIFAGAVAVSLALPVVESLTGWKLTGIARACQVLWGLFFIGATARSLWRARHEGFYSLPWLCCAAGAWALLLAALAGAARYAGADVPELTPYTAVLIAGLLCIPLASVAWAPLSLAALRHQ